MSQFMQIFFKPTYYLPEEDKELRTSVQMISIKQARGDHALAIAQAVCSIARAIFISIPYYFLAGTGNLLLNCGHLNFECMVLGHYKASMQSLVYSVTAIIYTILGIFIPSALNGFKMDALSENVDIQEVFKALQEGKPHYFTDDAMVEENWKPYQEKDRAHLFEQVNMDLPRSDVRIDGIGYKDAQSVFEHLTKTGKMNEELVLKVMAQIQQGVFLAPFMGLRGFFDREELALHVLDYPEKGIIISVETTKDCVKIEAQNHLWYKTIDSQKPYFREGPVTIFDTRVLLEIPKDGSACRGHWTWKEIPV